MRDSKLNIAVLFFILILTQSLIYSPQPLLQAIAARFEITSDSAVLLMTLSLLPLSLLPIICGILLERFRAKSILNAALFATFIAQILLFLGFKFSLPFAAILAFKGIQALCFPFILITLFTTIQHYKTKERLLGFYVATIILGGLLGRLLSGFLESNFGIEATFLAFCVSIFCAFLASFFFGTFEKESKKYRLDDFKNLLKNKRNYAIWAGVFLAYFAFQSIANLLPFLIKQRDVTASTFGVALGYVGYISGIFIGIFTPLFLRICHGERGAIFASLGAFVVAISAFYFGADLTLSMLLLCCAMFGLTITYSVLNAKEPGYAKSGAYLFFYYGGGALGSYFGAFVFAHFGLDSVLFCALVLCIAGAVVGVKIKA